MDSASSSEEQSSSECTTDSSDNDDKLETAQICGTRIQLPQGLCEQKDVFTEFFSAHTWNSLSEINKQHLKNFLPTFPESDEQEKNVTLQRLFNGDVFRFNSTPLAKFHENLKAGHYRPDIAKMRFMIKKAERKEAKLRHRRYRECLKVDICESRKKLVQLVKNLPPGVEPRVEKPSQCAAAYVNPISHRAKRRYFQELSQIRSKVEESGFSSDENYPEGPSPPISRKQKRHLNSIKNSQVANGEKLIVSSMTAKLNGLDLERIVTPNYNPFFITEDGYRNLLVAHKRRRLENPCDSELKTKGLSVTDIIHRTKLPYIKKPQNASSNSSKHHIDHKLVNRKKIKKEPPLLSPHSPELMNKSNPFFGHSSNSEFDSDSDSSVLGPITSKIRNKLKNPKQPTPRLIGNKQIKLEIKVEHGDSNNVGLDNFSEYASVSEAASSLMKPMTSFSQYGKITPATLSDLDGIDMMNLPIDLDDSNIDILEINNKPELMQETHSNFLSLIRDIICSTNEHRMNLTTLEERLKSWQENPISPLNDWYSLTDNWVIVLRSAINFLSGNFPEQPDDFVPYIEYKPQLDMYQWIGAGRDADSLLLPLCQYWLERRNDIKPAISLKEDINTEVADRSQTPPPPRCPTNWTVRKADHEDVKAFREQERRRYDNPHRSFTYRCNGYESVVGPLKGIYNQTVGPAKARGHTMLNADRPNFVTILTLVRDATARLPNGEGTRADICELLKSSQYIASTAPDNVLQSVVSGALDRMHTQIDPCVKYDPKRKLWIYLHRNRSEEDFERIHQQYQGMNKYVKKPSSKGKSAGKSKSKNDRPNKTDNTQNAGVSEKPKSAPKSKPVNVLHPSTTVASQHAKIQQPMLSNPGTSKQTSASLLLPNKSEPTEIGSLLQQELTAPSHLTCNIKKSQAKQQRPTSLLSQEEKEINEALQAIVHNRGSSPVTKQITNPKTGKSLVKIISPNQGKSLIIPSSNTQVLKSGEQRTPTCQINQPQAITQQLLQTIAAQQKHMNTQQTIQLIQKPELVKTLDQKTTAKVPMSVQQQILQSISPQQLHNIKNIALIRNVSQSPQIQAQNVITPASLTLTQGQTGIIDAQIISPKCTVQEVESSSGSQASGKSQQPAFTPVQQQRILQNLKQKVLPLQPAVLSLQQQAVLKQKAAVAQLQKQVQPALGTSLLGQTKLSTPDIGTIKPMVTTAATPLIAKVLTNAAGQVISVESLLAHQRQHGSLPQGTTLRVSGAKGGQANIIQLATSSPNSTAQFTVVSQNNFVALTSQPKLVVSTPTTTCVTSTVTVTKPKIVTKTQTVTKFSPKIAQQLINAKFITQNIAGQKIVQPKVLVGQNQIKIPSSGKNIVVSKPTVINTTTNANAIRMVNAANLNLTHISGKPVLLTNKNSTVQNIQGQSVIIQSPVSTCGPGLVVPNTGKTIAVSQASSLGIGGQQSAQVILGSQLKVQQAPQVVLSSNIKPTNINITPIQNTSITQSQIMFGGQPVRLQTSGTGTQRVVLASQGQGGQIVAQQILLPAGFQGAAINIKALQGVKVIPIAQTQQGRGLQGRQVFARIMNPSGVVRAIQPTSTAEIIADTTPTSE